MKIIIQSKDKDKPINIKIPNDLIINRMTLGAFKKIKFKGRHLFEPNKIRLGKLAKNLKETIKISKNNNGGKFVLLEAKDKNGDKVVIEL